MLQTMANNDRGWAKLVSAYGRVVLVQQGTFERVEIWESGIQTYDGPTLDRRPYYLLDELSLNFISMLRVMAYTFKFTKNRKIDLVIASNHNCGLAGLILKAFGKARKTVTFMTDFLPIRGAMHVRIHRLIKSWITEFVANHSDELWLVSPRIPVGHQQPLRFTVPIVLNDNQCLVQERLAVGYIGNPSPDHGLEILFEICHKHGIPLHVIGDSPYLNSIKHLAPQSTVFHGVMTDQLAIGRIISKCFCGYAIYRNTSSNSYSYYGFPSKTLPYLANNVPVVTTRTSYFSDIIGKQGIGLLVQPEMDQIEDAILTLKQSDPIISAKAINDFRSNWNAEVVRFHHQRFRALYGDGLKPLDECEAVP
jgi:glycosyltransferase involved in cell wall biosynthesis